MAHAKKGAAVQGYSRRARRPRSMYPGNLVSEADADAIEARDAERLWPPEGPLRPSILWGDDRPMRKNVRAGMDDGPVE